MDNKCIPVALRIRRQSRVLEVEFEDGVYALSFEFLRVHSPSAEVRGHAPGDEILQTGKRNVMVNGIEPVGNYGMKPAFDDGHASGIYTWEYLYQLAHERDAFWERYLDELQGAGYPGDSGRDVPMQQAATGGHCHH